MAIPVNDKDLGIATAYAYAVAKGYTGTEEEFAELMASYAEVAERAAESAAAAAQSATEAAGSASAAGDSAAAAAESESAAADSETAAAGSASFAAGSAAAAATSETNAAGSATAAAGSASTASSKAVEASQSASSAAGSATAAQTAQGAAETAQAAAEAAAEQAEQTLESYAKTDGSYDAMTVGVAKNLESSEKIEDKVPYVFRPVPEGAGNRETDTIIGGTVVWNQLSKRNSNTILRNLSVTDNADGSFTVDGTADSSGGLAWLDVFGTYSNHVYAIITSASGTPSVGEMFYTDIKSSVAFNGSKITKQTTDNANSHVYLRTNDGAVWDKIRITVNTFDLTAMFGPTIADYIYSLETANAGAGVEWFRELFDKDFYSPNLGELMSVNVSQHKMVGYNQWDEEWEVGSINSVTGQNSPNNSRIRAKNYIPILSGKTYYNYVKSLSGTLPTYFYDAEKKYIGQRDASERYITMNSSFVPPNGAVYMRFVSPSDNYGTTYKHDICINISSDRNGEYEPYHEWVYPLDGSKEWRGIFKLDANNNLYSDGDIYPSSGNATRRYGKRPYQSGDESLADAITDGTITVYKLTTPTSETAEPYTNPQSCNPGGTEEYVDAGVATGTRDVSIPVGHDTLYNLDLVGKLEDLPSDFSTLIAPTEKAYKATRAYSVNQFLIVKNQLYKVTASIANGGTITPGTNVTATTICEVLTSLL